MIITEEMVLEAIEIVKPSVIHILRTEGKKYLWGPRWSEGWVFAPGLNHAIPVIFGTRSEWDPSWGEGKMDFDVVARRKANASARTGKPSGEIVDLTPWLFKDGEFLYPGAVTEDGITVGFSALKGRIDELFAWMLLKAIKALAQMKKDGLVADHLMQI